jgi:hypothetical protein
LYLLIVFIYSIFFLRIRRIGTKVTTLGDLPERRVMYAAHVIGGKFWIFAGQNPAGKRLNDLWDFDLTEAMWTQHTPTAITATDSIGAYSCGAIDREEGEASGVVQTVEAAVLWPVKRSGHASTVVSGPQTLCGDDDTLVVFGGVGIDGKAMNDLWYWCPGVQQARAPLKLRIYLYIICLLCLYRRTSYVAHEN